MVKDRMSTPSPAIHGSQVASATVGDLVLFEASHPPNMKLPWHFHEHASITYLFHGSYTECYKGAFHECTPASVLIKRAGEMHCNYYGEEGARSLIITFPPTLSGFSIFSPSRLRSASLFQTGDAVKIAARLYSEFQSMDAASPLVIEGLVRELLGIVAREVKRERGAQSPAWLEKVRDRLHDEFPSMPALSDLAAEAGVHPDHLSRRFQNQYGMLVGEYVRHLRMRWAARELTDSTAPLSDIALSAGFTDQSHFTRTFKRHFGITPARYRKEMSRSA